MTNPTPYEKRWFEEPRMKIYVRIRTNINVPEGAFDGVEIANIETKNDKPEVKRLMMFLEEVRKTLDSCGPPYQLLYLETPWHPYYGELVNNDYQIDRFNTSGGRSSNFYRFSESMEPHYKFQRHTATGHI